MAITAKSCDYPEAVLMANTLAEMLLEAEINIAKRDFEIMRKFANEKLISSAATYKKAMEETKKARDENATLNLSDDVTYLTDEINRIKQLINTTELNMNTTKIELEVNKKKLAARPMYMKASEQLKESSVYSGLRESISDLQVELAKIRTQYTAKHPDYIETEIQLKEAKDQLAKEVLKVYSSETIQIDPLVTELIQSVASDEATIAGQEEQLRSCNVQIKKLQSQVAYYTKTQMEMDLISSREAAAGDIYESMLDFLTQIEAAESMALANLKIIEPATISKKIGKHKHPSILINSILGFILACFFAFCGVVALEYIDPRIYNISGIPETDTMPIKTAVPDFLNKTKWFPKMPRKIPFRIMARKVAAELHNSQSKVIALVPFKTKTGCSTVAAGLSSELTSLGKKVLVLNLDKPSEKPWNSIERVQATASDLLSDKVKRKDSAVTTADINVDSTAQIKEVTSKLRDKYDLIIIDMPPPLHKESAFDTLDSCDAYMLVVKAGASSYASINNIMQFIQPHAQKLGLIINRTTPEFWSLFSREINL
ncbi:hypothetical protein BVX94_03175 [bacterium B17]|nr:hypothetical protein BVX94_03175 [bacterium B17]